MDLLAVALACLLVALNGFFVAFEFAIVKVRPTRIEELIRKNRSGAVLVRRMLADIDGYLSATQLGITLASLGLGWIGEPAFARLLGYPLELIGISDAAWLHRISLALAFITITFLHIVLGELAPKTLAIVRAESVAIGAAYPMRWFYVLLYPLIWLLNSIARAVLRVAGLGASEASHVDHHSEEEIRIILHQARSAGLLSADRSDLLRRAMSLSAKTARHLMVPRNDVIFLDTEVSYEENMQMAKESGHSRFPLCNGALDEVVGLVNMLDVLRAARSGPVNFSEFAQPIAFFPEMMSGERLLREFRTRHATMAIVVDEYGGASGIITPNDIVTAVMGELEDVQEEVVPLPGGAYEVEGVAPIEEIEERLRIHLPTTDMRTIAGFLMERLGRMPRMGDRVSESGYLFQVTEVQGPRVRSVRIQNEASRETRQP